MLAQALFIAITNGAVTAAAATTGKPALAFPMGADMALEIGFHTGGTVAPLAAYDFLELYVQGNLLHAETVVLFDATAVSNGSAGVDRRYTFTTLLDSTELRALVDDPPANTMTLKAQVIWKITAEDEPRVSDPFDILVTNLYARRDSAAPSAADAASEAWLTTRAIRFDVVQTLTDAQKYQAMSNMGLTISAGGFLRMENAAGDVFHLLLNSGEPPS